MFQDKFVFSKLLSFLDRNHFNYLVHKYVGDKYVKHFSCWNARQYDVLQILGISLTDKASLRDLLEKTNFNDVKELDSPLIPGLFD